MFDHAAPKEGVPETVMAASPIPMLRAPHRLPFLVGSINLAALAGWWLLRLAELYAGIPVLPAGDFPPGLLHGPAMLNLVFPPFVFGFLLTVFPRWMGYPDIGRSWFAPIGFLLLAGSLVALFGLWSGHARIFAAGLAIEGIAWAIALVALARTLIRTVADRKPPTWHGWSAMAALCFGLLALALTVLALGRVDGLLLATANRFAIAGFLLPLFLTVAHRMVPFFAGNVVQDYRRWRPDWLLAVIWGASMAVLAGHGAKAPWLVLTGNAMLSITCALMAWKWWPRSAGPGLLKVLFWGLAWAPVGFALSAAAVLAPALGRAPDHALLVGFAASLLIAMVTRVTQGHSGRPLEMSRPAWFAFWAIQLTAVLRIGAALYSEQGGALIAGGILFLGGVLPWCLANGAIYTRPRVDGKPG